MKKTVRKIDKTTQASIPRESQSGSVASAKLTQVSAAVILREQGGKVEYLLAQRPPGKAYAGYWEFPGGKVEAEETFAEALVRELQEELGITVTAMTPWITRHFVYPHARVEIRFFRATAWEGTLHPLEHTDMAWLDCALLAGVLDLEVMTPPFPVQPVLPANTPILRALALPESYAITNASDNGVDAELMRLRSARPPLVQVREKQWPDGAARADFCRAVVAVVHAYGGRVLFNGSVAEAVACGADGVHLTSATLMSCDVRPDLPLVFASCHDAQELRQACVLGLDAVVLGPVSLTATHPDQAPIGWDRFALLIAESSIPVYALGGMALQDIEAAKTCGAQGVAMMRGW